MRYVSRIIFCLFCFSANAQEKYQWDYLYTIDGDSLLFYGKWIPLEKKTIILRLDGIDTPERHSLCKAERELAEKAKEFVKERMERAIKINIYTRDWDKFGGRILGRVELDGKDLSKMLLDAGLAREYHGERKTGWC